MNKGSFKKHFALFLSFIMVLSLVSIFPSSVQASDEIIVRPGPRLVSGLKLTSDVTEVDGGNSVTFTASFLDTLSMPEPVTITTTNGAVILVDTESDISFSTNGINKDITDLYTSPERDEVTFLTGAPEARKISSLVFKVEAPLGVSSFDVRIQVGTGIGAGVQTIKVISGLTIEAPDEANDEDSFFITGNASYKGQQPPAPCYIFAEIINKETGEPMDEIQYRSDIVNQRYSFGPITLPSTYNDAVYVINVYMMHDDIYLLGSASKEIKYVKVDKTENISLTPDMEIYSDSREVIVKTVDDNGNAIPFNAVVFDVTGNAVLSHSRVDTGLDGTAKITVSDSTDEYVILYAKTTSGKAVSIPLDFREVPNLAFHRMVEVSDVQVSEIEGLYRGENVIDGLDNTRWASSRNDSWVEIDFGESFAFDKVTMNVISSETSEISSYKIIYLLDGQWKTAYEGSASGTGILARFPEVNAEKVRIHLNGKNASVCELSIFNTEDYVLTVRDRVIATNRRGDILTETTTMRQFIYHKGDTITPVQPEDYEDISLTIPPEYGTLLQEGIGKTVIGVMPDRDVLISYQYKYVLEEGVKINVIEEDDGVKLDNEVKPFNFIWVANSSKGTVVKINTDTGEVLGEYKTAPDGQPKNPSRTTVDKDGSIWVTNRDGNSVIKIGLKENGQWIDRNGNGVCDTSIGLNDVLDWSNLGGVDTNGGVSTALDECILLYVRVSSTGTRHLSIDGSNNIWVSGTGNRIFDLLDTKTGEILRSEGPVGFGGYGGLIDKNGVIWSSNPLLRWDTKKPLSGANGVNWTGLANTGGSSYGLAIDTNGNVWNSINGEGKIRKYNPSGTLIGSYNQGHTNAQGCVVDRNNHVWVAHSSGSKTVGHLTNDGTYIGTITVSPNNIDNSGPTGVAVDGKGFIWATCYDGRVVKIDPTQGPIGADGKTRVGAVVFTTPNLGGNLYNYSDMTGSTLIGAPGTGTWEFITDSKKENTFWNRVSWEPDNPDAAQVEVYLSASHDNVTFSNPVRVTNPDNTFDIPDGRYLKVTVRLNRPNTGISPVIKRLSVDSIAYD